MKNKLQPPATYQVWTLIERCSWQIETGADLVPWLSIFLRLGNVPITHFRPRYFLLSHRPSGRIRKKNRNLFDRECICVGSEERLMSDTNHLADDGWIRPSVGLLSAMKGPIRGFWIKYSTYCFPNASFYSEILIIYNVTGPVLSPRKTCDRCAILCHWRVSCFVKGQLNVSVQPSLCDWNEWKMSYFYGSGKMALFQVPYSISPTIYTLTVQWSDQHSTSTQ